MEEVWSSGNMIKVWASHFPHPVISDSTLAAWWVNEGIGNQKDFERFRDNAPRFLAFDVVTMIDAYDVENLSILPKMYGMCSVLSFFLGGSSPKPNPLLPRLYPWRPCPISRQWL